MPFLLDPKELEAAAVTGDKEANIAPFTLRHEPRESKIPPYEHIYGRYKVGIPESLYWRKPGKEHPFREYKRLQLCLQLIQAKPRDLSENIKIARCLAKKRIVAFFPLHNPKASMKLKGEIFKFKFTLGIKFVETLKVSGLHLSFW